MLLQDIGRLTHKKRPRRLTIKEIRINEQTECVNMPGGDRMFGLIGNFGPWEMALILVVVLLIFGPGKLPRIGESMGKALNNFKKARQEDEDGPEDKQE